MGIRGLHRNAWESSSPCWMKAAFHLALHSCGVGGRNDLLCFGAELRKVPVGIRLRDTVKRFDHASQVIRQEFHFTGRLNKHVAIERCACLYVVLRYFPRIELHMGAHFARQSASRCENILTVGDFVGIVYASVSE